MSPCSSSNSSSSDSNNSNSSSNSSPVAVVAAVEVVVVVVVVLSRSIVPEPQLEQNIPSPHEIRLFHGHFRDCNDPHYERRWHDAYGGTAGLSIPPRTGLRALAHHRRAELFSSGPRAIQADPCVLALLALPALLALLACTTAPAT